MVFLGKRQGTAVINPDAEINSLVSTPGICMFD
jgi:hypothetical protein